MADLLSLAKEGDLSARKICFEDLHCHIYTIEEVKAFNVFRSTRWNMEEGVIQMDRKKRPRIRIYVGLDPYKERSALINWLKEMGAGFFIAGLEIEGVNSLDPYDGALTEWVLKMDDLEGFIPMFCSLYEQPKVDPPKEEVRV